MSDPGLTPESLHDFLMSSGVGLLQAHADKLLELGVSAKSLLREGIAAQLVASGQIPPIAASDIVAAFRASFQPGSQVAVYWDYDRVNVGKLDGGVPTLHAINAVRDRLSIYGPISVFNLYCPQDSLDDRHAVALTDAGAQLVSVPRIQKRGAMVAFADKPIIADALIHAYQTLQREKANNLLSQVTELIGGGNGGGGAGAAAATTSSSKSVGGPVVVIVSDDPDFAPLLSKLKNLGGRSVVVTRDDAAGRVVHGCATATLSFPSSFLPYFLTIPTSPQRREMGGVPSRNAQESPTRYRGGGRYQSHTDSPTSRHRSSGGSGKGGSNISPGRHGRHRHHHNNNDQQQQQRGTPGRRKSESPPLRAASKPPLAPPPHVESTKTFPALPDVFVEDASPEAKPSPPTQNRRQRREAKRSLSGSTSSMKFVALSPPSSSSKKSNEKSAGSNPLAKFGITWKPILGDMEFSASPTTMKEPQFVIKDDDEGVTATDDKTSGQQNNEQQQQQHRDPATMQEQHYFAPRVGSLADLLSEDPVASDLEKLEVILQQLHDATGGGELSRAQCAIEVKNVLGNVDFSGLIARAEAVGLVSTGGRGWNAWISLNHVRVDEADLPQLVAVAEDASPERPMAAASPDNKIAPAAATSSPKKNDGDNGDGEGDDKTSSSSAPRNRSKERYSATPLAHEQCWMSFRINRNLPASTFVLDFDPRALPAGVGVVQFDVTTKAGAATPYVIRAFGPWADGIAAERFAKEHFSNLPFRPRYYARPPEAANAVMFKNQL